jgi:hypothetical protein
MNLDSSLNTAEGVQEGMVAPGQEALLDDFVKEQEAAQQQGETDKLLGKFNSPDELAKAYQELEKKLGQRSKPTQSESSQEESDVEADDETEGEEGEEEGGEDDYYAMTEEEVASIKDMVGGEEGFQKVSQWARENLQPDLLKEYNDVVSEGNVDAIRWAVRAIAVQALGGNGSDLVEPELVGGGKPDSALKFESQSQVLDAMNKRNDRGQRLYDVDEAYRGKVQSALLRSDVF